MTCDLLAIAKLLVFYAEGTDNLDSPFEATTFGVGDWVLAFYSAMFTYYGW